MSKQWQIRRGTTAQNDSFTGAEGELTMDTTLKGLRIHDGSTEGGIEVPTAGTADYVVEFQAPTALNNYTWYRKYKSGWVEQGGVSTSSTTITLPITMDNTNYSILFGNDYYSASAGTPVIVYYDKTTTSFAAQGRWNGTGQNDIGFCWKVEGMAAQGE